MKISPLFKTKKTWNLHPMDIISFLKRHGLSLISAKNKKKFPNKNPSVLHSAKKVVCMHKSESAVQTGLFNRRLTFFYPT